MFSFSKYLIQQSHLLTKRFPFIKLSFPFSSSVGSHLDSGTIYALSTGYQKSGIGVIRVSGKNSKLVLSEMTDKSAQTFKPRYCYYTNIYYPNTKQLIDKSVLIYYSSPHSYTGEDIVEIQCHGGTAVISSILDALSQLNDFRPARAGEFTRRGFLNSKYDITEIEALGDLLQAETEKQREQAILGYSGQLNQLCETWKKKLIDCLSYMETLIDFSDNTDDLDEQMYMQKQTILQQLNKDIQKYTTNYNKSQLIRNGLTIPIYGAPNVGKSSLLNKLIRSEKAIVSPYEGTTRDIIEVHTDLNGYKIIFQDTAGIHQTQNEIEQLGIQKAIDAVQNSVFKILIMDVYEYLKNPTQYDRFQSYIDSNTIIIMNKIDLIDSTMDLDSLQNSIRNQFQCKCKEIIFLSCKADKDVHILETVLSKYIDEYYNTSDNNDSTMSNYLLNTRQQQDLLQCQNHIQNSLQIYNDNMVDAVAEELRLALGCLGRIVGQVNIESVLDDLFSKFCIGK